jgi:hypothetical protein
MTPYVALSGAEMLKISRRPFSALAPREPCPVPLERIPHGNQQRARVRVRPIATLFEVNDRFRRGDLRPTL